MARIQLLVPELNKASIAYYNTGITTMSDAEYDKKYDELKTLETKTGYIMTNSPTQHAGAQVVSELETVVHNHPMLSLDKCHSVEELIQFAGDNDCDLMMKMDGLTTSLEYLNGHLIRMETRGDGVKGSNIIHNAVAFKNVPLHIPYDKHLIIDGETIVTYNDFDAINESLPEDKKFKNPRNLASGSVQLLDSNITKGRNLKFIAWKVIEGFDELEENDSNAFKLMRAGDFGFEVVPNWDYSGKEDIKELLSDLRNKAEELGYPIDGAVMLTDLITVGNKMGRTDKFFRHSIAYKFDDEDTETTLRDIEWSMGRTGTLTPVAIFDTVKIDGTDVNRASLHNVSIVKNLKLGIGDKVTVYKANMIIPQIRENFTQSNNVKIPNSCPICGYPTAIQKDNDSEVLVCKNPNCKGKLLGTLTHFVSKPAMNIDGLSEATLQKFIELGWLNKPSDIFSLCDHADDICTMDGFGTKSAFNLFRAIESAKNVPFANFIVALGIPLIGKAASKQIAKYCADSNIEFDDFAYGDREQERFLGKAIEDSLYGWISDISNYEEYKKLISIVDIQYPASTLKDLDKDLDKDCYRSNTLSGKTFVITGSLSHYKNRDELVDVIEKHGGKVASSVSKNTFALINNDCASVSSKNQKAQKLGVQIITEEEFVGLID